MKKSEIPTFKVWSLVDNTPLTCFDFVSDALRRKSWDDMTDEARIVETIDQDTRIIYVRAKGIWPTAGTCVSAGPTQPALSSWRPARALLIATNPRSPHGA